MSSAPSQPAPATPPSNRLDVQIGLLLAVAVITGIGTMAVALLFPPAGENGFFSYASVEPDRDFIWAFLTLAAVNLVCAVVAASLVGVLLTPGRGWQWTTAGFVVAVIGGALYAIGIGGWAMVFFFGTDTTALDPAIASGFIDSVNTDGFHLFVTPFSGAILVTFATMLFAVGLWRSGNLPKWVILLGVIGSVITYFLPTEGVVGIFVEGPQAVATVLTAWYLWRQRHELYGGTVRST